MPPVEQIPQSSRSNRRRYLVLALALLMGLALSALAFFALYQWERGRAEAAFAGATQDVVTSVEGCAQHQVDNLYALAALFKAFPGQIDAEVFRSFARPLLGQCEVLLALGWAPRVRGAARADLEQGMRRSIPGFEITERTPNGGLRRAESRAAHFPILLLEPLAEYRPALGFDLASCPEHWAALQRARDSGTLAIADLRDTRPYPPDQSIQVMLYPIYEPGAPAETAEARREHLQGVVAAVFRVSAIVAEALDKTGPGIDVYVYQTQPNEQRSLVYAYHAPAVGPRLEAPPEHPLGRRLSSEHTFEVADHYWTVVVSSATDTDPAMHTWLPWSGLGAGLLGTLVLVGFLRTTQRHTLRVERLAEKLHKANETLDALIQSAPLAIAVLNREARVRLWNPAAEQLFGWSEDEVRGQTVPIIPEDQWDDFKTMIEGEFRGEVRISQEMQRLRKDGSLVDVHLWTAPVHHIDGEIVGSMGIFQDITDRKGMEAALRAGEARLRAVVETVPAVLYRKTVPGYNYTFISPAIERVLGFTAEEGMQDPELFVRQLHEEDRDRVFREFNEATARRDDFSLEYRMFDRNGTVRWIHDSVRVEYDSEGKAIAHFGVASDITERKRLEQALREREEALREAERVGGMGSWEWDSETDTVTWSEGTYALFGRSPSSEVPQWADHARLFAPGSFARLREAVQQALQTGTPYELDLEVVRADGTQRWIIGRGEVRRNRDGTITGMHGTVMDVTERREGEQALRESEERLRIAVSVAPIIVCTMDSTLRFTWINAPVPGTSLDQIIGHRFADFLERPKEATRIEAAKRGVLESGKGTRHEFRVHLGGQERIFDARIEPVWDATRRVCGVSCAAVDVTEYVQLQATLREQAERLAEADRRKDEFLAVLAHELRNPLAPVSNAVEVLKRESAPLPPTVQWAATLIGRQVGQLTHLVNDLLDVARITRGRIQLHKQTLLLADVIARALDTVRSRVEERHQRLNVSLSPEPLRLEADAARLTQIFGNLLDNATKYTPEGGRIEVMGAREDGSVLVQVRDNGIGIAPEQLPHLFEPFTQVDRSLARAGGGGLGLGLALAKTLVEMHGGSIEAESAGPGQGSVFSVRLPLADTEAAAVSETGPFVAGLPSRARRLLVIEDNTDVAESFALLLRTLGHEVHTALDGRAGLAEAERFAPELAFVDIGLPDIDGYEVARRLRERYGRRMRLVAVTGYGQEQDRLRAREAGFEEHLLKPVALGDLERLLAAAGDETT